MASGTISCVSLNWEGQIRWTSSPIPGKNASTVTAEAYTKGWKAWGNNPFVVRLSVGSKEGVSTFARLHEQWQRVGSVTATVNHDSEGRGAVTLHMKIVKPEGNSQIGKFLEGSKTVTLDPIQLAKPSRLSFSQDPIQMGKNLLISIERDQPDCTHTLSYVFGSRSGTLGENLTSSFQWTVPDLSDGCENALEGLCTVTCSTYRSGSYLGKTEKSLTLQVPDGGKADKQDLTLGTAADLKVLGGSPWFRFALSVRIGEAEYTVGEGRNISWTPPYDLALLHKDLREFGALLRVRSYNGTALVGTADTPIRMTVPENEDTKPRISQVVLTPVTHGIPEKFGYLRGKTGLQAQFTAESSTSSIAKTELVAGRNHASGNPAVIQILEDAGALTVKILAEDLRGFQSEYTKTISVTPYEKPRVIPLPGQKTVICQRAGKEGALRPDGTLLAIRAGLSYTEIGKENSAALFWRWRREDGVFTDWMQLSEAGKTEVDTLISQVVTSLHSSYQVELSARDSLGAESTMAFSVMSEAISFVLYDGVDGASFGKYPELPHVVDLAPHMTLLVRGKLDLRGHGWQDLGLGKGILPPVSGLGRYPGCGMRNLPGNHVYLNFGCRMPGETMAVNESPVPEQLRPAGPVSAICPCEGGMVLVCLGEDGFIRVSPGAGNRNPGWIDGNLDYFY